MKILKKGAKPWACAAREQTRYAIRSVRVLPSEHQGYVWAEATDGRKLARVLMEATAADRPDPKGTLVPIEAFKAALRDCTATAPAKLEVNGSVQVVGLSGMHAGFDVDEGNFPDTESLAPGGEPKATVALNVRHLCDLADAFGCDVLEMDVREPEQVVVVRPVSIALRSGHNASLEGSVGYIATVAS